MNNWYQDHCLIGCSRDGVKVRPLTLICMHWTDKSPGGHQRRKYALAFETLTVLRWDILSIMLPRFLLVALSVAQPFLINEAVNYVESSSIGSKNTGYGLIGAFAFVYIGTAVR